MKPFVEETMQLYQATRSKAWREKVFLHRYFIY